MPVTELNENYNKQYTYSADAQSSLCITAQAQQVVKQ